MHLKKNSQIVMNSKNKSLYTENRVFREFTDYTLDTEIYIQNVETGKCYFADYYEIKKNPENYLCFVFNKEINSCFWKKFNISVKPEECCSKKIYDFVFREYSYLKSINEFRGIEDIESIRKIMLQSTISVGVTANSNMCVYIDDKLQILTAEELFNFNTLFVSGEVYDIPKRENYSKYKIYCNDKITVPVCVINKRDNTIMYKKYYLGLVYYEKEQQIWRLTVHNTDLDKYTLLARSAKNNTDSERTIIGIA